MSNSTEVYCLNAYDNLGNFLCTLRCGQPSEIGQDYAYLIPNIGNREVDYICYTDKCGCACCLSNENEIIIHSTQGEIKTFTSSVNKNCIGVNFSELFGGNWCKTMVRYKTGGYPTSISDGSLGFEELTQNQYCSTIKWITGLSYETTYYLRAFALDGNNNIISNKCVSGTTGTSFVTTCRGYTGGEQSIQLGAGTYKLEVWGASGGKGGDGCCGLDGGNGGCGGYSSGCITLSSTTTLYIYVGGRGCNAANYLGGAGGYNGGGKGICRCGSRGGGGGGATHIATASGLLCTLSGNQSAVKIVAGGGGGTTRNCNVGGGHGGGLCGTQGGTCRGTGGGCGTQSGGGTGGNNGGFGYGGNSGTGNNNSGGGGGGGWYGGGGGYSYGSGCMSNGGGGSGYIGGVSGGITCRGNEHFPTPAGGDEIGHNGCGCVKISPI